MVADHVDHRRPRPARIVDVCPAIQIARAKVQQRHRRTARHPRMSVRGARCHALEKAQHGMDARLMVQRRHKVHFRRAGICKTGRHTMIGEGRDEGFGASHRAFRLVCHRVSCSLCLTASLACLQRGSKRDGSCQTEQTWGLRRLVHDPPAAKGDLARADIGGRPALRAGYGHILENATVNRRAALEISRFLALVSQ